MRRHLLAATSAGLLVALASCGGGESANEVESVDKGNAAAGSGSGQTIAAGLEQNSRFYQAARAAGLDATLAGPGPYTVLVPSDEAFGQLADGGLQELMRPESRARLTNILTYHILPGTVLVEDINRAIENSNGRAILATMGGETLTAAREGERILLSDASGTEAVIVRGDEQRSNGVVHHINAVLTPAPGGSGTAEQNATE